MSHDVDCNLMSYVARESTQMKRKKEEGFDHTIFRDIKILINKVMNEEAELIKRIMGLV